MKYLVAVFTVIFSFHEIHASEVRVIDGDTIDIGGKRIRLFGIDAPEKGQRCKKANGKTWKCGMEAAKFLNKVVKGQKIVCDDRGIGKRGRNLSICYIGSASINEALVRQGYAWAYVEYSDIYIEQEAEVRSKKRGVWAANNETPWDYRKRLREVAVQISPNGCLVKGNIRNGIKIFHTPWGSSSYKNTKISPEKGEYWFCGEREAYEAGWRAPLYSR